jgi:hypothetical protein
LFTPVSLKPKVCHSAKFCPYMKTSASPKAGRLSV